MMQQTTKIRLAKALGLFARQDLAIVLGLNGLCLLLALNLTPLGKVFIASGFTDMQQIIAQRAILALYLSFAFILCAKTCSILVFISADPGVPGEFLPEPAPTAARRIISMVVVVGIVLGFWLILRYQIPFDTDLGWTMVPAVYAGSIVHALLLILRRYQQQTPVGSEPLDGGASN
jgi:hypothetical protein